ncbi:LacI family DNA-binding transcriptional regulator [Lachnospiraceae bacterium YH-ros2228]
MGATIKDVAKLAGVSPSTVSRVLNNKRVISPETSERIHQAMKELNYVPNDLARSFAKASSHVIGLAVDTTKPEAYSNRFFNKTVFALETVAQQKDFSLMIVSATKPKKKSESILRLINGKKLDGIVLPADLASKPLLADLEKLEFPVVIVGKNDEMDTSSWVDINNIQAGRIAAEHLLSKEYENFLFLMRSIDPLFEKERVKGFVQTLEEQAVSEDRYQVVQNIVDQQSVEKAILDHFNEGNGSLSVLCSNDRIAVSAIETARKHGIKIPEQLGILCFDNTDVTELMNPSISCINVDTYAQGLQAAEILIQQINQKDHNSRQVLISTDVIERDSTAKGKEIQ